MKKNYLYCLDCKKPTKHTPKLSAMMSSHMVCSKCSRMNGFCALIKTGDETFIKTSKDIRWLEYNNGAGNELHELPAVGYSLLMSPFDQSFTWLTTPIVKIIECNDGYVKFTTENSEYELFYNKNLNY